MSEICGEWIGVPDVCRMTGLCREVVYQLIEAGELVAWRMPGRRTKYRVDRPSVIKFLGRNMAAAEGMGAGGSCGG